MTRVLNVEPPEIPLDVVGQFIRLGVETYVHYDQIAGFRAIEVAIVPAEDEEEVDAEAVLDPDLAEKADDKEAAKQRVAAAMERVTRRERAVADAPRIAMTQVYLQNRYGGSLVVDQPEAGYTSQPLVRHGILQIVTAMEEAALNRARSEAKVMSGVIAREISADLGADVEDTSNTQF